MRGVTIYMNRVYNHEKISTHTPHARRDHVNSLYPSVMHDISTHTPHARRDHVFSEFFKINVTFQLTRLMRGVTRGAFHPILEWQISTHTPHARRDHNFKTLAFNVAFISTHTPHARRDQLWCVNVCVVKYFNSHASCEA